MALAGRIYLSQVWISDHSVEKGEEVKTFDPLHLSNVERLSAMPILLPLHIGHYL